MHLAEQALVLVGCMIVTLGHFWLEPLRWNRCYLPSEYRVDRWANVRDALFSTALATYLLPFKLGIPLRMVLLGRYAGLSAQFTGMLIAVDGMLSLIAWSSLAAASLWLTALHWQPPAIVWVLAVAMIASLIIALVVLGHLRSRWLQRLREAFLLIESPWRRITTATLVLLGDVFSYGVRHALLVLLVTGDPHLMLITAAIGIVATFAGIISGLPMGLLGYDATLIGLLALVGVQLDHALLVALINRALNLTAAILLGLPATYRLGLGSGLRAILRKLREMAHGHE